MNIFLNKAYYYLIPKEKIAVSEITSIVKSVWLGNKHLWTVWAAWIIRLFLSVWSKTFFCFSLWKALTSPHHSMRGEEGKKRYITKDCKTASSNLCSKWDTITQILRSVWKTCLQFTCLNVDSGHHLRQNRVPGTPHYLFPHKEKLCLSGVTASELTRYLQGLEVPQNICVWQLYFFHSGFHCLCPAYLF